MDEVDWIHEDALSDDPEVVRDDLNHLDHLVSSEHSEEEVIVDADLLDYYSTDEMVVISVCFCSPYSLLDCKSRTAL